jgi:hypothetical protein
MISSNEQCCPFGKMCQINEEDIKKKEGILLDYTLIKLCTDEEFSR